MRVPQIYVGHEDLRIQQAFDKVRRIIESIPITAAGDPTFIRLNLDGSIGPSTITSTQVIPVGSTLIRAEVHVYQVFDGGATIEIKTNSAPPTIIQSVLDNNPTVDDIYEVEPWLEINATNSGNIVCTVGGAPTQGKAVVMIEFVSNPVG